MLGSILKVVPIRSATSFLGVDSKNFRGRFLSTPESIQVAWQRVHGHPFMWPSVELCFFCLPPQNYRTYERYNAKMSTWEKWAWKKQISMNYTQCSKWDKDWLNPVGQRTGYVLRVCGTFRIEGVEFALVRCYPWVKHASRKSPMNPSTSLLWRLSWVRSVIRMWFFWTWEENRFWYLC